MAISEVDLVDHVRKARRIAQRAGAMVSTGVLGPDEIDACMLLFGDGVIEDKLAPAGLMDDGGMFVEAIEKLAVGLRARSKRS